MNNIIVLGAGMVGSAIAIDLAEKHSVTSVDLNPEALSKVIKKKNAIQVIQLNTIDEIALKEAIRPFDLVINALPGFLGYEVLKRIIESGKDVVDISFFPENALDLDSAATKNGVTAIVDCGVAPGMGNLILGYYNEKMRLTDFECLVGGLPKVRKWPFKYKAPFSPVDVIEEYTRPARYVENGIIITKPAMSDVDHIEIEGLGTLETFNSDGLRSILFTMPHIKNMKEKTMRYPGHIEKIRILRDSGFFSKEPIVFNDTKIIPLEFTSKILFNDWKLNEMEEDITVMRVTLTGEESGVKKKIVYNLFDKYDKEKQTSSMARTTGYTASAAANLILERRFNDKGVFPPELIGKQKGCLNYFINYLKKRGVIYTKAETTSENF